MFIHNQFTMIYKSVVFLFLIATCLSSFSQTKLKGGYNPKSHEFISDDPNINIKGFSDGLAPFMIKGKNPFDYKSNHVGFIDTTGRIVIKPVFADCSNFKSGVALVYDTLRRLAMINEKGSILIPFREQSIELCDNGLIICKVFLKSTDISLIDRSGRVLVPFGRYSHYAVPTRRVTEWNCYVESPNEFRWEPMAFYGTVFFKEYMGVKRNLLWAIIDKQGKEIAPPKFDSIGVFNQTAASVIVNGNFGVTDTMGHLLIPALYENTALTTDNFVIATKNKKSGVLSLANKLLIPFNYKTISQISSAAFLVDNSIGEEYATGVINSENITIVPLVNRFIEKFGSGYLVHRDNFTAAVFDAGGVQKTDYTAGNLRYPVWEMHGGGYTVYNENKLDFIHYETISGMMYYRDKKWGLLDSTGVEATEAQYDDFRQYGQFKDIIAVRKDDKWGMINSKGQQLLPHQYDNFEILSNEFWLALKDHKYGLIDKNFHVILPAIYDQISLQAYTSGDYNTASTNILAKINGKWGCIDLTGKKITDFKYDRIESMRYNLSMVMINHKWGLINSSGSEIAPCIYDGIQVSKLPLIIVEKDGLSGLISRSGKMIKATIFNHITVEMIRQKDVYMISSRGKTGIIDIYGKEILPLLFERVQFVQSAFAEEIFIVGNSGNYGVCGTGGKIIIPLIYKHITVFDSVFELTKRHYLVSKNGKYGLLDDMGKQIIPFVYDRLSGFQDKKIIAIKNGRYGLINWANEVITPFSYDEIYRSVDGYFFKLQAQCGMLNFEGKEIVPPIYDYINQSYNHIYFVHKDGKIGIVNGFGKIIVEPIYDSYSVCNEETYIVEKDHLMGLIDYKGKVIYPCKYTSIKCADGKVVEIY